MMQLATENAWQFGCACLLIAEHGAKGDASKATAALPKKIAAGHRSGSSGGMER
jgi:hypothetical protein